MTSVELQELQHKTPVAIAGLVVARQRPSTANGIVFMLLEDEHGQVNLVVPPPVYEHTERSSVGSRCSWPGACTNAMSATATSSSRVRQSRPSPAARLDEAEVVAAMPGAHHFGGR